MGGCLSDGGPPAAAAPAPPAPDPHGAERDLAACSTGVACKLSCKIEGAAEELVVPVARESSFWVLAQKLVAMGAARSLVILAAGHSIHMSFADMDKPVWYFHDVQADDLVLSYGGTVHY